MDTLTYGTTVYNIEAVEDNASEHVYPAQLVGPRGARYSLFRNIHNPNLLFLVNARKFGGSTPFEWVTIKDGALEVVR